MIHTQAEPPKKPSAPIDVPTLNHLDRTFRNALQKGENITPETREAIYDDYVRHRMVDSKEGGKQLPESIDEFITALTAARTAIQDKLRDGSYPAPKEETSVLLDAEVLRKTQLDAAFRETAEAAKATIISRSDTLIIGR